MERWTGNFALLILKGGSGESEIFNAKRAKGNFLPRMARITRMGILTKAHGARRLPFLILNFYFLLSCEYQPYRTQQQQRPDQPPPHHAGTRLLLVIAKPR